MALLGIDLGSDRVRTAASSRGTVRLVEPSTGSPRVPFVVHRVPNGNGNDRNGIRFAGLMRLVDAANPGPAGGAEARPGDLLAALLRVVRADVELQRDDDDTNCVLAVPCCASERTRSSIRSAAVTAGFSRVRLVDETTAALLASQDEVRRHNTVLVCCWRASAFSAACYRAEAGRFRLIAQEQSDAIGVDDLDSVLSTALLAALERRLKHEFPAEDAAVLRRVVDSAVNAKAALVAGKTVSVAPSTILPANHDGSRDEAVDVTPEDVDRFLGVVRTGAIDVIRAVLDRSACQRPDIVLASGDTTHLPGFAAALQSVCDRPSVPIRESAFALGAALFGARIPAEDWGSAEPTPSIGAVPAFQRVADTNRWSHHFLPAIDTAQGRFEDGQIPEAIQCLDQVFVDLSKFRADLCRKEGAVLAARGRPDDALKLLKAALARDPKNVLVAVDFARLCWRKAEEDRSRKADAKALATIDQGIAVLRALDDAETSVAPPLAQLTHFRGCLLSAKGRLPEAAAEIAESVRLDPKQVQYKQDLATIRAAMPKPRFKIANVLTRKIGRNDLCPCGSGRKSKKCCAR